MSGKNIDVEQLEEAHKDIQITVPRWVIDILIASSKAVADANEAPDDLRRDCESAAKIAQSRLDNRDVDTDGDHYRTRLRDPTAILRNG